MRNFYQSVKSRSLAAFLIIIGLIVVFSTIGLPFLSGSLSIASLLIGLALSAPFVGFFLWVWFDTNYTINEEKLIVKNGPFRWRVPIEKIRVIRLNQKTISGIIKPTLSWNSIKIEYHKYSSMLISPQHEEDFIDALRQINPDIVVKNS